MMSAQPENTQIDNESSEIVRPCPNCDGLNQAALEEFSLDPWHIVKCGDCGFVYLSNPVEYEELVENHAWEKNFQLEAERRRAERSTLDKFSKATRWRTQLLGNKKARRFLKVFKEGKILDIGCGSGTMLPEPLVPYGVEISKHLSQVADEMMQKRGGYCVHASATEGVKKYDDNFFDGVLLHSFLEHENHPATLLRNLHPILKPSGAVYIRVPNFASLNRRVMGKNWCGFRYPDHVNYFTLKTLRQMAAKTGFQLTLINKFSLLINDNIIVKLKKKQLLPADG